MPEKIEEIFNDCFERLLAGESLESCIYRYPEHAEELDIMLRTAFDVKRKAYPIQPRPEFKYWARVRMNGVQDYMARHPVEAKPSVFHWRRSWAVALSAVLVFVLVTGGTAAASSEAMPDQPLYNVKLAVEQAQVALTFSDANKAELHARLAERRAQEIANMAGAGKTDKVIATTVRMNYQLEQAVLNMQKYEAANSESTPAASGGVSAPSTLTRPNAVPAAPTGVPDLPTVTPPGKTFDKPLPGTIPPATTRQVPSAVNRAKTAINTSNAKSLKVLENALEKAPDSVKPTIKEMIERTRQTNVRLRIELQKETDEKPVPPVIKQNTGSIIKPRLDIDKPAPFSPLHKPKSILTPRSETPISTDSNKVDGDRSSSSSTTSVAVPAAQGVRNTTSIGPFTPTLSRPSITGTSSTTSKPGSTSVTSKSNSIK